ncbi:outer membrane lipoprotein chaperone LolA [Shewanella sp. C32]|uniref:Outer-membrane lipoprotein carrier protein n=1 Tax=Shewanella electrica TaxID=515560 RepID=A0ABT2FNN6_9GAMM|nr:outer membrane lipoprotein chaperone LolA [Shewanella electrica]MCH1926497.1 outer membrane lipoprotein chaperone LolA [Shewanella electrica]MCS4557953.1 outer membrane lipoprotein chaperone LolA [Shewanella electrica]
MTRLMFVALSLCATSAIAATPAEQLQQKLDANPGFQAEFKQTVTDVNQKVIQSGTGSLALAQPNHFYWHLQQPDESLIVADGKDVWIYNPFAEEVSVLPLDQAIATSPMTLLVHRDASVWNDFDIKAQNNCYTIDPKSQDAGVQTVSVCFDGNKLTEISLNDNQGNHSEFALSAQQPIKASAPIFTFTVPEGVSVDDQRGQ